MVPLQEAEVVQAIRLLTRFGQVQGDPNASPEVLQKELTETDPNTRLNLQQLLGTLAAKATAEQEDTPLLMKAAEHMAIRFALERYQKGEVKVNAVHQMMEHMSRQMDSLRQILKLQEEKMNKAGILVEIARRYPRPNVLGGSAGVGKEDSTALPRSSLRSTPQCTPVRGSTS